MTSYDANGAPVETEAAIVKRYPAMVHLMTTPEGLALADAEPRSVVLGDDHDAAVQRLSEQLAEAKRECDGLREKLADANDGYTRWHRAYCDLKYPGSHPHPIDPDAEIKALSTAIAAERERGGRGHDHCARDGLEG